MRSGRAARGQQMAPNHPCNFCLFPPKTRTPTTANQATARLWMSLVLLLSLPSHFFHVFSLSVFQLSSQPPSTPVVSLFGVPLLAENRLPCGLLPPTSRSLG